MKVITKEKEASASLCGNYCTSVSAVPLSVELLAPSPVTPLFGNYSFVINILTYGSNTYMKSLEIRNFAFLKFMLFPCGS
jgi:hypothetical protein